MGTLGIQDVPVRDFDEDSLGIEQYAKALKEFIVKCDTPMTIALQGDWGSGKTSLMQLIRSSLKDQIIPIEFNTWEFSQFNMASDLPVLMMEHFAEEVDRGIDKQTMEQVAKVGKAAWKAFRKIGGAAVATAAKTAGVDIAEKAVEQALFGDDPLSALKKAKRELSEMVAKRCEIENGKRIVVFIDDLDRLTPIKALEVLEVMKVFLDIENCVFLLACDFEIVRKGIKEKFKIAELSGKSFFDKIFQLSFHMPTARYDMRNYLKTLMDKIGFSYDEQDLSDYLNLVRCSIGFNARNIKRLFNSLVLLKTIQDQTGQTSQSGDLQKVLFAVGCMEMAYNPLHNYIMYQIQEHKENLTKAFGEELQSLQLPETISKLPDIEQLFGEASDKNRVVDRITEFMGAFVKSLQIDDETTLSEIEIKRLSEVMALTSLTSSTGEQQNTATNTWQDEISLFCRRVRDKLYQIDSAPPERYSRKAVGGSAWRDYALWYNQQGWEQWQLAYHLTWFEVDRNFRVGLLGNWDHIARLGLNRDQIQAGFVPLETLDPFKFKYADREKEPGIFDVWTDLGLIEWNSETDALRVTEALKQLITATKHLFTM